MLVAWLHGCLRVEMWVGQIGSNQLTNKVGRGIEKDWEKVDSLMLSFLFKLLCLTCTSWSLLTIIFSLLIHLKYRSVALVATRIKF